jgi:uncharacterized phage-associated protein
MADVYDVAQYILEQRGEMTAMKLQKLVYYSQAWHIAWTDDVLFSNRIEAWADGPVTPDLFARHRGFFRLSTVRGGDSRCLTEDEKDTIDRVLGFYGAKSPQWLSDLTHMEDPWKNARRDVPDRAISNNEITPDAMGTYYASL